MSTYVGHEHPHHDEEMEEVDHQPLILRPNLLQRLDRRVHIEVVDHRCDMLTTERVIPIHVREILQGQEIFFICPTLPHDMEKLMHQVFDVRSLIYTLRNGAPKSKDDNGGPPPRDSPPPVLQ